MPVAHAEMTIDSGTGRHRRSGRRRPAQAAALAPTHGVLYHLFWIFVIMSVIGLVGETVVSYFIDGRWESRAGLVWGPFSPIYGGGAVLVTLVVDAVGRRARKPLPLGATYLASAVGGAGFELFAGWFWKHAFGIVAWSYADQPFNIGGYTCLGIALVWGAVGVAWSHALPGIIRLVDAMPAEVSQVITPVFVAFIVLDVAVTFAALGFWFMRIAGDPVSGPVASFFAAHFNDAWMQARFETMSILPQLAG